MAQAIIKGLLKQGLSPEQISATTSREESAQAASTELGIHCHCDNHAAVADADIIVLAVKPQKLEDVCQSLKASIKPGALVLSVAAGIRCSSMEHWLGSIAIARSMPNTPSAIGLGASGLYSNSQCSTEQKQQARAILEAVGICAEVEQEQQIDAVTAVSGSAPAYFFLFAEAMIDAGEKLGLNRDVATQLALQTAHGAAALAQSNELDVAELRRRVTSPKGTTEQAILSFEKGGLRDLVENAMRACTRRAAELSDELGNNS